MDSDKVRAVKIPMVADVRGNLSFVQHPEQIPFAIKSVSWVYDVPFGVSTDGKRFANRSRAIVALSGSFDVVIHSDCETPERHRLSRPYEALCVPPTSCHKIVNFSTNAVAMTIASAEDDDASESAPIQHPAQHDGHSISLLDDCRVVNISHHTDAFGSMAMVENDGTHPFDVCRVFYLYDVPADSERGGHSHFEGREYIVAVSGCFDVILDDGRARRTFTLNRPYKALFIPAGIWREINNFSSGSVCLVLTSTKFAESDYCRDYAKFKELTNKKNR